MLLPCGWRDSWSRAPGSERLACYIRLGHILSPRAWESELLVESAIRRDLGTPSRAGEPSSAPSKSILWRPPARGGGELQVIQCFLSFGHIANAGGRLSICAARSTAGTPFARSRSISKRNGAGSLAREGG